VYAIPIPASPDGPWELVTIAQGIHRNHGLTVATLDGEAVLLISGDEGVFAWRRSEDAAHVASPAGGVTDPGNWRGERILESAISEIGVIDIDGDGSDELIAVEPFHGDALATYRHSAGGWDCVDRQPLSFGHGLSVGTLGGTPVAVVGNRSGSSDLTCFTWDSGRACLVPHLVDSGVGTAGTTVFSDAIVASNPGTSEYARYTREEQG
jgi:hypothetical protein